MYVLHRDGWIITYLSFMIVIDNNYIDQNNPS